MEKLHKLIMCIKCGSGYLLKEESKTGELWPCPECAKPFRAGEFFGEYYMLGLFNLFKKRTCPGCGGNNFYPPGQDHGLRTCYRQCKDCCATWLGTEHNSGSRETLAEASRWND